MQDELLKVTTELQTVSSSHLCLIIENHSPQWLMETALKEIFCANKGSEDI